MPWCISCNRTIRKPRCLIRLRLAWTTCPLMCKDAFMWNYLQPPVTLVTPPDRLLHSSWHCVSLGITWNYMQPLCNLLFGSNRYQAGHTVSEAWPHIFCIFWALQTGVQDAGPQISDHTFFVVKLATTLFSCHIGDHIFLSDDHRVHIGRVSRNAMCVIDHSLVSINQCALRY